MVCLRKKTSNGKKQFLYSLKQAIFLIGSGKNWNKYQTRLKTMMLI